MQTESFVSVTFSVWVNSDINSMRLLINIYFAELAIHVYSSRSYSCPHEVLVDSGHSKFGADTIPTAPSECWDSHPGHLIQRVCYWVLIPLLKHLFSCPAHHPPPPHPSMMIAPPSAFPAAPPSHQAPPPPNIVPSEVPQQRKSPATQQQTPPGKTNIVIPA